MPPVCRIAIQDRPHGLQRIVHRIPRHFPKRGSAGALFEALAKAPLPFCIAECHARSIVTLRTIERNPLRNNA
jgi:hypothetical protein